MFVKPSKRHFSRLVPSVQAEMGKRCARCARCSGPCACKCKRVPKMVIKVR